MQPALPEPAPSPLRPARARPAAPAGLTGRDAGRLLFVAEMHGVQLDLLAALMRTSGTSTRTIVSRWQQQGLAGTARLGPGAAAGAQSRPFGDVRGPVEYKRAMAAEMTLRALRRASERALAYA